MQRLPDAVVIVDLKKEAIGVREANRLGLAVIGLVDTNCDPDEATYVIPGNDDAIRACNLILGALADAVLEGKGALPGSGVPVPGEAGRGARRRGARRRGRRPSRPRSTPAPAAEAPAPAAEAPAPAGGGSRPRRGGAGRRAARGRGRPSRAPERRGRSAGHDRPRRPTA